MDILKSIKQIFTFIVDSKKSFDEAIDKEVKLSKDKLQEETKKRLDEKEELNKHPEQVTNEDIRDLLNKMKS